MTVAESLEVARLFADVQNIPLHFEGWAHFTGRVREIEVREIERQYAEAGFTAPMVWPDKWRQAASAG